MNGNPLLQLKAALMRFCDFSWESLAEMKRWMQRIPNDFDVEKFNNPSLRIAQATNGIGETVCYCTIEKAYVIGSLAYNPGATAIEMQAAGAHIEAALAHQAQQNGESTLLMVVPDNLPSMPGERFIRVVERTIAPLVTIHGIGSSVSNARSLSN